MEINIKVERLFAHGRPDQDERGRPRGAAGDLVVAAPAMRRQHELIARVAAGGVNVLLLGGVEDLAIDDGTLEVMVFHL